MLQPAKSPIYPSAVRKFSTFLILAAIPLFMLAPARAFAASARKHRTTKLSSAHAGKQAKPSRRAAKKSSGQRAIDDQRATEIQSALVKAGYLNGEPSGHWGAASQAAMVKLQSDNGWQTKLVPDSRALIKLGLGPGNTPASGNSASSSTASNR